MIKLPSFPSPHNVPLRAGNLTFTYAMNCRRALCFRPLPPCLAAFAPPLLAAPAFPLAFTFAAVDAWAFPPEPAFVAAADALAFAAPVPLALAVSAAAAVVAVAAVDAAEADTLTSGPTLEDRKSAIIHLRI